MESAVTLHQKQAGVVCTCESVKHNQREVSRGGRDTHAAAVFSKHEVLDHTENAHSKHIQ